MLNQRTKKRGNKELIIELTKNNQLSFSSSIIKSSTFYYY